MSFAYVVSRQVCVGAAALVTLALLPDPAEAQRRVGVAAQITSPVTGTVRGRRRSLSISNPVFFGERLSAGRRGLGQFILNDNTKLALSSGANLVLDNVVVRRGRQRVWLRLVRGAMRFATGISGRRAYRINSATATLGVRGTKFDVFVKRGRTFVLLLEGQVRVCGRGNRRCRILRRKCDWVEVNRGGRMRMSRGVRDFRPLGSPAAIAMPFLSDGRLIPGLEAFGAVCANFRGPLPGLGIPLNPFDRPDNGSNPNNDRPVVTPDPPSDNEDEHPSDEEK
ncbi:MAG: FecR family protein [Pseudomonadota bacterium]